MAIHRHAQALRALPLLALVACGHPRPDNAAVCKAYAGQGDGVQVVAQGQVVPNSDHAFLLQLSGSCDLLLQVDASALQAGMPAGGATVVVSGTYDYAAIGGQLKADAISPVSSRTP